ncbi:DUF7507 domain-containing protein [Serinibacter arcticus]|nr:DUF11 domain-containing protein [Serinibacter arcticus]
MNVLLPVPSANAAPICEPGDIYVNTGGATPVINRYSPTGELLNSAPTEAAYTDIAFSADGLVMYGILDDGASVFTFDPETGAELGSVAVVGLPTAGYFINALSALPDGDLLVGAAPSGTETSQRIYRINPITGVATQFGASFPEGFGSAGDFLSLPDGDLLAIGLGQFGSSLFRIAPDFTVTNVGTVPVSFGAAQSGGNVYLAGAEGTLYEINDVPTAASTAPVAVTALAVTGLEFFGATSQQDSGLCSELNITKTSTPPSGTLLELGQTVTYSITLSNINGTAPAAVDQTDDLTAVLDDAEITSAPVVSAGSPLTIAPVTDGSFRITGLIPAGGESTITYAVTVNDPATGDGVLTNYVIPTGTTPPASCETGDTTCTSHPVADPSLTVVKSVDPADQLSYGVGQEVTYSFVVTNTGNVTLTDVVVNETAFDGTGELGPLTPASVATLAPAESTTFTATYTLTQADVDRGSTTNTATATGTPPVGPPVEAPPSTVEIPSLPSPALTVVKSVDPADEASYVVGQEVTYSFVVTNTGNVTLADVVVNETAFDGTGELGPLTPASVATLAPAASTTFTATYTLTQADVDRGSTTNTATATGTPPVGPPTEAPPSTVEIPSLPDPALTVVKSSDTEVITAAGQEVTYSFVVTNTGNVTITDAAPVELDFSGTGVLGALTPATATLVAGQSATFTAIYTVTQADVDAGELTNTATATGTPPPGTELPPVPPSEVTIPGTPSPALAVVKSSDTEKVTRAGQVVTYSFVVTNTGNVTLNGVTPVETQFSGTGELGALTPAAVTLSPGESQTFSATYTVTREDLRSLELSNTAIATGTPPEGGTVTSPPSSTKSPIVPAAASSLPETGATVAGAIGAAALLLASGVALTAAHRKRSRTTAV